MIATSLFSAGSARVDEKQRLTLTRESFLRSDQDECAQRAREKHLHELDMLKKDLEHNQAEYGKLVYAEHASLPRA